jgi:hypothetical protein
MKILIRAFGRSETKLRTLPTRRMNTLIVLVIDVLSEQLTAVKLDYMYKIEMKSESN